MIEKAADESGRSMNAEILWRLERSFMTWRERYEDDARQDYRELNERLKKLDETLEQLDLDIIAEKIVREAVIKHRKP